MSLRRLVTAMRALRNRRAVGKKVETDGSTLHVEDSRTESFSCPMVTSNEGIMEKLDKDSIIHILSLLISPSDLARAACVCRSWRRYVIEGKLWRSLCYTMFSEIGTNCRLLNYSEIPSQNTEDGTEQAVCLEDESFVFEVFLRNLLRPPGQRTCISEPLHATSTDNLPLECIAQTLHPEPEYEDVVMSSYWSSRGHPDRNGSEKLTYRLVSDLCVVDNVQVRPFLADFQAGRPIYSAQMVRFRFGYPRVSKPNWAGLFECFLDRSRKVDDDEYVWTYVSPSYQMTQEDTLQIFKLPKPTLCMGGIFQLELLGSVQTQESDGLYYICICHVHVSGHPLPSFKFEGMETDGCVKLKQLNPKQQPRGPVRPMAGTPSLPQSDMLWERLRNYRNALNHMHYPVVDVILQYLLKAGFFEEGDWQQDYA